MKNQEDRALAIHQASTDIEQVISECGVTKLSLLPPLVQTIQLADGLRRMREILTEPVVKKYFMPLQGSPLGFVTDKDKDGGYDWLTVRDVITEGLLRGFRPVGNELNIIKGRFYGARAGFERVVNDYPGVSDVRIQLGVPAPGPGGTSLVAYYASWIYYEQDMSIVGSATNDGGFDSRIAVIGNAATSPDAVLGKATRKLYALIYRRLTGCSAEVVDAEPADYAIAEATPVIATLPEGKRMSLSREPGDDG